MDGPLPKNTKLVGILEYDLGVIDSKMAILKKISDAYDFKILFPVKSFPHSSIIEKAAFWLNGFDVSNRSEFNLIKHKIRKSHLVVLNSPSVNFGDFEALSNYPIWFSAQTPSQVLQGLKFFNEHFGLRVSPNLNKDNSQNSRFGFSLSNIEQMSKDKLSSVRFLNVHKHDRVKKAKDFLELADALNRISKKKKINLSWIGLGGGFENLNEIELKELMSELRKKYRSQKFIFEPGAWISKNSGRAIGDVIDRVDDGFTVNIVTNLSKLAHCRWSRPKIAVSLFFDGKKSNNRFLRVWGPTCSESDILSEGIVPKDLIPRIGEKIVLNEISGYSYSWNSSFNGIPKAKVKFISRNRGQ